MTVTIRLAQVDLAVEPAAENRPLGRLTRYPATRHQDVTSWAEHRMYAAIGLRWEPNRSGDLWPEKSTTKRRSIMRTLRNLTAARQSNTTKVIMPRARSTPGKRSSTRRLLISTQRLRIRRVSNRSDMGDGDPAKRRVFCFYSSARELFNDESGMLGRQA